MNTWRAWAKRVGIQCTYINAWGERQALSAENVQALLQALQVEAGDGNRTGQTLTSQQPMGLLPPVVVVEQPSSHEISLRVTGNSDEARWRLIQENGEVREGKFPPHRTGARRSQRGAGMLSVSTGPLPLGVHRLEVEGSGTRGSSSIIVVPPHAFTPPRWSEGEREWAITVQLYSLRSDRNWGIGDFSDLADLACLGAQHGAHAVGVNPLHALFPADPTHISPYAPSSRLFLNPIYLDVTAVPEFVESDAAQHMVATKEFQRRLQRVRASEFVDYPHVWNLKLSVLRLLHGEFHSRYLHTATTERASAYRRFVAEQGEALTHFATFEALQAHFGHQSLAWRKWPEPYRTPTSPETRAFREEHRMEVEFSQYLQWEADRQLALVARTAQEAGMRIGLYRDLAVGLDPNGAEAWSAQDLLAPAASIGAPPDVYNPKGQDWGLAPFNPLALERHAYRPFLATIRANMRHAGALRVDHVIGLKRLWWIVGEGGPQAGGYVSYPLYDLLSLLALESERHGCLVVGEDLGTVPEGFREELHRRRILSYRLLLFERKGSDGEFVEPEQYPALAATAVSTHDLATFRGMWEGRDLEWRRDLGLYPSQDHADQDTEARVKMRTHLQTALRQDLQAIGSGGDPDVRTFSLAAHRFLARTPSRLLLVQLEDVLDQRDQMNLPGTIDEHPNWRRRLTVSLQQIFDEPFARRLAEVVATVRADIRQA
jgi:4-alpha-glucanotransferase